MELLDFISYEALDFFFTDEGEVLERDISEVHVLSILYCKDRLIDFTVDIYGSQGKNALPIYSQVMPVETGEVISIPNISPLFVLKMFDDRILKLFSAKEKIIFWNPQCPTSAMIDPISPDPSIKLIPEKH